MKRGAYKVSHIRILDDEPKVDYDELRRLQHKYKVQELGYRMDILRDQMIRLEKEYERLCEESL